jgi:hypothetical protein
LNGSGSKNNTIEACGTALAAKHTSRTRGALKSTVVPVSPAERVWGAQSSADFVICRFTCSFQKALLMSTAVVPLSPAVGGLGCTKQCMLCLVIRSFTRSFQYSATEEQWCLRLLQLNTAMEYWKYHCMIGAHSTLDAPKTLRGK